MAATRFDPRAERAGVVQLASWGVLPDVAAASTPPIRQVVFHYADGEQVSVEIKPSAGVEALYAPTPRRG